MRPVVTPFLFPVAKDFLPGSFLIATSLWNRREASRAENQFLGGRIRISSEFANAAGGALVAAYEDSVSRTITSETRRDIKAERRGKDLLRSIGTEFEDRVAAGTGRLVELPVL
jgi:hypothetical protein